MTWLWVLGIIGFLLFLLCMTRVGAWGKVSGSELTLDVKFGVFQIHILPKKEKKPNPKKEAKKADFAKVSAVFHNRLEQNMKLESDPTIHYVTGERRMSLRSSDLAVSSPYNTYRVNGLPAGPICNPSPEAINAALYPDESYVAEDYLFFCSKNPESGELHFSRTLSEHERAVEIYVPLWQAYDAERGM